MPCIVKITDRGYWVSTLYKYQSLWYWLCYSLYFRSITFFSAANPAVHLGGMLDDRKSDIYSLVDPRYVPKTLRLSIEQDHDIECLLEQQNISFPLIVKPNVGFKGFLVKKIDGISELNSVMPDLIGRDMLFQEYVDLSREFSVMCYRRKDLGRYKVSSLVEKHLPTIVTNGVDTIYDQIMNLNNPFLKKDWVLQKMENRWGDIPEKGEVVIIDHVGNYARGSKFESLNDQIDDQLENVMNEFFSFKGLNFGRLDVKASSLEALKNGDFLLLEINGAKAEPIHIYDPKMSVFKIMGDIRFHWNTLFHIVKENISQSKSPSSAEGLKSFRSLKKSVG